MSEEKIRTRKFLVPGTSSAQIQVISEKGPFKLRKISVSGDVADSFFVTDIKVGRNSQFVSAAAIPASFFAAITHQENLVFDTTPRGVFMTIEVTNMCAEAKEFEAELIGELVEGRSPLQHPNNARCVLGLGHTIVDSKGTTTVCSQAQAVFGPDRLFVPAKVLESFRVLDVRVVGESVAGREELQNEEMSLAPSVMQFGDWLCIDVANDADSEKAFYGAVVGRLVQ